MIKIQFFSIYTNRFKIFSTSPQPLSKGEGQKKPRNLLRGLYLIEFVNITYSLAIHAPQTVQSTLGLNQFAVSICDSMRCMFLFCVAKMTIIF
jgi:homoserine acetyltransferase